MARIKIKDGGDKDIVLDYIAPITGISQSNTGSSIAVTLATIAATDIVLTQLQTNSTAAAHVNFVTINAGTGFTAYLSEATVATLAYAVFHPNA